METQNEVITPMPTAAPTSKKFKVRLSIGTKLVSLIALLLMTSVVGLVFLSTKMFIEDNTALIQQINLDSATGLATQVREILNNLTEKIRVMGSTIMRHSADPNAQDTITEYFSKDKDFVAVFVYKHETDGNMSMAGKAISPDYRASADSQGEKIIESISGMKDYSQVQVAAGEVQIGSIKLADESQAVVVGVPFMSTEDGKFTHTLTAIMRQSRFIKIFSESDVVTSFLIDKKGRLLAHADATRVGAGENMSGLGVVKKLLEGKFNNGQTKYLDPSTSEAKLGAYRMVGFAGLAVVSEVPEAKAFEAAKKVVYRSILVAVIILSLAFFAGFFFSGTISKPIRMLVEAAKKIAEGNFKINLTTKGRDEVAHLAMAFNEMAMGLEERDRVKDTFNKFHNKEIAEKLLSGEVKLGGERREAVIFFSDVRGFTGMSESMEPEQVVEMLNEYMTRMVAIVIAQHGVVDKYVGDAIMSLWGVPLSKGNDAENALMACVLMRIELNKLNELRVSRGHIPLKIGIGLHIGQVIAGNIGSNQKMEYTVIGDTVNLASRIESMTKEYGTDLLVSQAIHDKVKDKFIFENCKSAKVKGKSEAIVIYKVRGYVDAQGQEVIVETPYSSYATEKSDKVVHEKNEPVKEAQATLQPQVVVAPVVVQAPQSSDWYFRVKDEVFGTFTLNEVTQGLQEGELSINIQVARSQSGPWIALDKHPSFKSAVELLHKKAA